MKKCPQCERELDKHAMVCQYCNQVNVARENEKFLETLNDPRLVVQIFTDEVINRKNLSLCDRIVVEDFIEHVPLPGQRPGREGLKEAVAGFHAAFPDLQWTIEEQICAGEKVVSRFTWSGTHRGAFLGMAPTGRPVKVWGVVIDLVRNGQMIESRIIMDTPGLQQQLGIR